MLVCTLHKYGEAMTSTVVVAAFWVTGVLAYFMIFALVATRFGKFEKPVKAELRT